MIKRVSVILVLLILITNSLPFFEGRTFAAGEGQSKEGFNNGLAGQLSQFYKDKKARTFAQRKIDSHVLQTAGEARSRAAALSPGQEARFSAFSTSMLKIDDAGNIEIKLNVSAAGREQLKQLEASGMKIIRTLPEYGIVEGSAPYGQVESIAALDFVRQVSTPGYPVYNTGSINSEGDAVTRAAEARAGFGVNGSGIKVGVMSDGVTHLANSVASGDLPSSPAVNVLKAGSGDEGTAMLEIVNDLAPGSPLAFYAPSTSTDMVAGIRALRDAGSKVIVDDITFFDEPKFEDGPIALEARAFYTGGGVYATSAGNSAGSHYTHAYVRATGPGGSYPFAHDYGGGDLGNTFSVPNGGSLTTIFQWNDKWGLAGDDFDIFLRRSDTGAVLDSGTTPQNGTGNPWEELSWTNSTGGAVTVYLTVYEFSLVSPVSSLVLDYNVYSRSGLVYQYVDSTSSVIGHSAVSEVLSTSTSNAATPDTIASYSSRGPGKVYFPSVQERQTPNITGIDGVSNRTGQLGFFSNPFYGTSAAAPHLGAIAALVWQANPSLTSSGVRTAILGTALDRGTAGWDATWGFGRVDAYLAVASVVPISPSVATNAADNITSVSAALRGSLTSLGTASSANVSFQWGTASGNLTQQTSIQIFGSSANFSANLTGLVPNTTYFFRARASGDGIASGSERSFATLPPSSAPPSLTTNPADNITSASAILRGGLTNLGTALSANVSFEWGTTSGDLTQQTSIQVFGSTANFSANLTGLVSNTTHFFRAKAVGDGTAYGSELSFATQKVPPVVATNAADNITGVSAIMRGNLSNLGTASSANVSFAWSTVSGNLSSQTTPQVLGASGNFSASLSGLSGNTTYYYMSKAVGDGTSFGNELSFTTKALISLSVTPLYPALLPGRSQQFTASGVYSDNSTANITAAVVWTSSNTSVASISSLGVATALVAGNTTITAVLGGVSNNSSLSVTASVEVNSGQAIALVPSESRGSIPLVINGIPGSGNGTGISGFIFSLTWNKDVIRVDNITAASLSGFSILAGTANNTNGTANITGDASGSYLIGNNVVANLNISAVGNVGDNTSINVTITRLVDNNSNPVTAVAVNAPVVIQPTAVVNFSVVLQGGGGRPDAGWIVPLTVRLFTPGVDVLMATANFSSLANTTKSGSTATANISGITPRTYDITVKSSHTLLNVKRNVVISSPSTLVNMGTLLEGNAKENTVDDAIVIDILDFSALSASFNKQLGVDAGYNANADFNRDGIVEILDFSLLSTNFNKVSAITVP